MTQPIDNSWIPAHKCGFYLTHNSHRDVYEDVVTYYDSNTFITPEEWVAAIETDSVWEIQWYPETPIGFHVYRASSLEALQTFLKAFQ